MVLGTVSGSGATEPSVSGLWQKIDAETGKPVGWFLFVERNGLYEGVIAKLFPRPGDPKNPICSSCRDDRKDAPLIGLPLVRDMKRNVRRSARKPSEAFSILPRYLAIRSQNSGLFNHSNGPY